MMNTYSIVLDALAEKIKRQEAALNLKKWQMENLEKKLKDAEAIIAEHQAKTACTEEEREG